MPHLCESNLTQPSRTPVLCRGQGRGQHAHRTDETAEVWGGWGAPSSRRIQDGDLVLRPPLGGLHVGVMVAVITVTNKGACRAVWS